MVTNDGGHTGIGGPLTDTDTVAINLHTHLFGTPDNDAFAVAPGNVRIDALGGFGDTITFDFRLVDASVRYVGNTVIIDGPSSHTVLTGFEVFQFTDGTVNNNDGIRWSTTCSTIRSITTCGPRMPTPMRTSFVRPARGPRPERVLLHRGLSFGQSRREGGRHRPARPFRPIGWMEGRVPSIHFDPAQYLAANPDVAAAAIDPLRHFSSSAIRKAASRSRRAN